MAKIGASESRQIKRAREKVKAHLEADDKQITNEALSKTKKLIHNWLNRHNPERIPLKSRAIEYELFDTNQHPEGIHSHFVQHLRENLAKPELPSLKGRIKPQA
jgi:hypothetical protein